MKDSLRFVYKQTAIGWVKVKECQSFRHARRVARELTEQTGIEHCVNT